MKELAQIKTESWLKAALVTLLLVGVYQNSWIYLAGEWNNEDFTYCYLVPFIVLYLIWEQRSAFSAAPLKSTWAGYVLIGLGIFLFWLGELGGEYTALFFSFWLVLVGLVWSYFGTQKIKTIWFPLALILAAFTPPDFIYFGLTLRLKLISSQIGVWLLQAYGMSAYREGNVIDLGFTQLQVVDACSGLRYLFPLLIMAVLLAYFYKSAWWKKVVLVASAVPLTILTNSFRIAMTGILYEIWGPAVAEDFFHGFSGWLIFIFGLAVLLVEMWMLNGFKGFRLFAADPRRHTQTNAEGVRLDDAVQENTSSHPSNTHPGRSRNDLDLKLNTSNLKPPAPNGWRAFLQPPQFIVAVMLLAGTLALAQGVEFREKIPPSNSFAEFPVQVGEWAGRRDAMEQKFIDGLHFDDYVIVDYQNGGKAVNFYTAYYESQRKGESIHSPETCLPGGGWEFKNAGKAVVQLDGGQGSGVGVQGSAQAAGTGSAGQRASGPTITVNRAVMEKGNAKQLSYFWFPQRDRVVTNAWELKIYNFWDALTRQRTDGALVRLITPVYQGEDVTQAEARLTAFTQAIVPVLNEFLPK